MSSKRGLGLEEMIEVAEANRIADSWEGLDIACPPHSAIKPTTLLRILGIHNFPNHVCFGSHLKFNRLTL